jgi:hypothetical protein
VTQFVRNPGLIDDCEINELQIKTKRHLTHQFIGMGIFSGLLVVTIVITILIVKYG